ncbi:MAG: hypothetical protein MI824_06640 [Hyphomicrobiales bacterium]|nr:hypothetical protein [Hyphomicrobiales bacterium]
MYERVLMAALFLAGAGSGVIGGEADVVGVKINKQGGGAYSFDVSVRHGDTGWKHYANKWDVVAPDGTVLGTRELLHPHENEQPFTRSLSGVKIPDGIGKVTLRAHDSVHGYGGAEVTVDVPR